MNLRNNLKNAELFRGKVHGARLGRGKSIPNKNIINLNIVKDPKLKILANIQGSANRSYVINIFESDNSRINIIHDCPDFKNGHDFCKHIVKILLVLDYEICKNICRNVNNIKFSSNMTLITESKTDNYNIKAESLIQEGKYLEAINFLNQAYDESNNVDYIKKIVDISLKYNLYEQFIKFVLFSDELFKKYERKYAELINTFFSNYDKINFQNFIETIINIQKLLLKLPQNTFNRILNQLDFNFLNNELLKYLLLNKFKDQINVGDYFEEILSDKTLDLKEIMAEKLFYLLNESILNVDSKDVIDSYLTIMRNCQFKIDNDLLKKVNEYSNKLKEFFMEGLKLKHASLRSLVITNCKTDKLRTLKFDYRYNFPSLIWTSPYRKEIPLHYFILEKCGFDKHHLEYTTIENFVENFPVFAGIFNGNNPIPRRVKEFWDTDQPKIINIVYQDQIVEQDFEVNYKNLGKYILIEWDLAQKPILGSYVCQFLDGFIIPEKNHPLTNEITPFDLILCQKEPIAIKSNNIKIYRPLRRINIKTAIELIYAGVNYISSYLPFDIITDLKEFKIDEIDAYNKMNKKLKDIFSPNKEIFKKFFHEFVQNQMQKDINEIYLKMIKKSNYKENVLKLIGFNHYSKIFNKRTILQGFRLNSLVRDSLQELKRDMIKFVSKRLIDMINNKDFEVINLKILKKYPIFNKLTALIIYELKQQIETCKIYQIDNNLYDISELFKTYYGKRIIEEEIDKKFIKHEKRTNKVLLTSQNEFNKLNENLSFLKLKSPEIII